ncbi:MAG: hypothetical protein ACFFB2_00850 [Promethearchaeota archaeon]
MRINQILFFFRIMMISCFILFTFIPLFWFILSLPFLASHSIRFVFVELILIILGFVAIYGILTLKLEYRSLVTAFFTCGNLFYLQNPYLLSLGVILSWSFYKIWLISFKYNQFDQEYVTYPLNSTEKQLLIKSYYNQLSSFFLLVWIILLISWGILFVTNNFFIEMGTGEFGTLGITISIAIILLVFLVQKYLTLRSSEETE